MGTGCVQIGKMMGCVVFAAASTEGKLARLKELGADVLVNYSEHTEFHRYVRSLTSGAGVDVVVNYTGGDTWVNSLKSLKPGGRLLTCGASAGYDPRTDIRYISTRELKIIGASGIRREDLLLLTMRCVAAGSRQLWIGCCPWRKSGKVSVCWRTGRFSAR